MKVYIPFMERFRSAMLNGTKTMTSRNKQYGNIGDTFDAFGATFVITSISKLILKTVAELHYKREGCTSPRQFADIWEKIHPIKGWVGDQEVIVHEFEEMI